MDRTGEPDGVYAHTVYAHTVDAVADDPLDAVEEGVWPVVQRGSRRIWDTIETAAHTFDRLGRPATSRLGISALDDLARQDVWLDDPDGPYLWPLPI